MTSSYPCPDEPAPGPGAGLLHVEVRRAESGAMVVLARGDLERASVPTLAGCLGEILEAAGAGGTVAVDLAGVDFVDVGGMLLLLGATRRAAERGSTLYLVGCNALLIRVLELTGNLDAVNVVAVERAVPDGAGGMGGGTAHSDVMSPTGPRSPALTPPPPPAGQRLDPELLGQALHPRRVDTPSR